MTNQIRKQKHPFHIVDASPWPLLMGFSLLFFFLGTTLFFHFYEDGFSLFLFGLSLVVIVFILWMRDIIREATFLGEHSEAVRNGLKLGFILFILSELMLFFAFFWAFFHASLNPVPALGCTWPPVGIEAFNPFHIPLLNTFILLNSGAFVTWCHYSLLSGNRLESITSLLYTIIFAVIFTGLQYYEYVSATFNISDSVFGTVFYSITGLHGLHVIVGTIFLLVGFFRLVSHHFTTKKHVGLEAAIWYWHFVDVVWIFVFFFVYWWTYPVYTAAS